MAKTVHTQRLVVLALTVAILFPLFLALLGCAASSTTHTTAPRRRAVLGATRADFLATYAPTPGGHELEYRATIAGERVDVSLMLQPGRDGVERVVLIDLQVPSDQLGKLTWPASVAAQIAAAFMPSDARQLQLQQLQQQHDQLYTSDELAATFPAALFAPAPAGAFSVVCQPWPPSAPGDASCQLALGGRSS